MRNYLFPINNTKFVIGYHFDLFTARGFTTDQNFIQNQVSIFKDVSTEYVYIHTYIFIIHIHI